MTHARNSCLGASEIPAYLDGALPEARRAEVDRHLDECRLCAAAVEGVAGLEWREGFLRSTDALLARVRARTAALVTAAPRRPTARFRHTPHYLTLAATLAIGVGAAIVLTRPGPGEALFQRSFEPYPSTLPILRGGTTSGGSNALALYEARDYRAALAALQESLGREPNDAVAHFYSGLCRLALGQPREATFDLDVALRLGDEELRVPAEWYLALAHLPGRHPAEARPILQRIVAHGGFYQDKAQALLHDLDRLEKGN
jgi:tetratricopeptide (TPR) repeat protein